MRKENATKIFCAENYRCLYNMDDIPSDSKIIESDEDPSMVEDWYHESDTSENIPEPNDEPAALYQDLNTLPVPLLNYNFDEGLLYTMTLEKNHD